MTLINCSACSLRDTVPCGYITDKSLSAIRKVVQVDAGGLSIAPHDNDLVFRIASGAVHLARRLTSLQQIEVDLSRGRWFSNWCPGVTGTTLFGHPQASVCVIDLSALSDDEPLALRRIIHDVVAMAKLGAFSC